VRHRVAISSCGVGFCIYDGIELVVMCRPGRLQQRVVFKNRRRFSCVVTASKGFSIVPCSIAKLHFRSGWYTYWKEGAGTGTQRGGHRKGVRHVLCHRKIRKHDTYVMRLTGCEVRVRVMDVEVRVPDEKVRSCFKERERECECLIKLN
jgi:hypothetical protein